VVASTDFGRPAAVLSPGREAAVAADGRCVAADANETARGKGKGVLI
jgi:hypothetical protein